MGEVVFRCPTMEKREVMLGGCEKDTESNLSENIESGYEDMESGSFVAMFVAGLNGLKQCNLLVPQHCSDEHIALFHLLFESQDEILTTSMLGNEAIVRTVDPWSVHISPHDAYVLGYCMTLSRCRWKLVLRYLGDEHIDMMKQAIASWGYGKGRIITVIFTLGRLTSDGVGHLLSLPHNTLRDVSELHLGYNYNELDTKTCEVLAHCLSSLPHLEILSLQYNQIGSDGAHLLAQSLHTSTTLRELDVSGNNIGNRGGCSLAEALSMNKGLEVLFLNDNPLGRKSIQQLIHCLQLNQTLRWLWLPSEWHEFSRKCIGYDQEKSRIGF